MVFFPEACDCLEGMCRKEGQLLRLLVGEEPVLSSPKAAGTTLFSEPQRQAAWLFFSLLILLISIASLWGRCGTHMPILKKKTEAQRG